MDDAIQVSAKTLDENWIDWEGFAFGFGYGTGEPHTIPALKRFLDLCPDEGCYDYELLEAELGSVVAWLLINRLCSYGIGVIEYGTSPRSGWLTERGRALKRYVATQTAERLIELACEYSEDYVHCYPDACNCGPDGYQPGVLCANPFWGK